VQCEPQRETITGARLMVEGTTRLKPGERVGRRTSSTGVGLRDDARLLASRSQIGVVGGNFRRPHRRTQQLDRPTPVADRLADITRNLVVEHRYVLGPGAREAIVRCFASERREAGFGNRRSARQLFRTLAERHAQRTATLAEPTTQDLIELPPQDVPPPAHRPLDDAARAEGGTRS
jgi:AAA lid domain